MAANLTRMTTGRMARRSQSILPPKDPANWRQLVYVVLWHKAFGSCPYCQRQAYCSIRIARLSNGFEARDVICPSCEYSHPERAGAGAVLLSPEQLAAERDAYGLNMDDDAYFESTVRRYFPKDEPITKKLYVESEADRRRRKSQLLMPWDRSQSD